MKHFIIITLILFLFSELNSQNYYRINSGSSQMIDKHGVCKNVTNNNAQDIFVPVQTLPEWQSFIDFTPNNVTISDCGGFPTSGCCGLSDADNYDPACNEPSLNHINGVKYYEINFCFYNSVYNSSYKNSPTMDMWVYYDWWSNGSPMNFSCADLLLATPYNISNYTSNYSWNYSGFGHWPVSHDMNGQWGEEQMGWADEMCDFYCWACGYDGITATDNNGYTGIRYAEVSGIGVSYPQPGQFRTRVGCKCMINQ